jgi:hypothetical protein
LSRRLILAGLVALVASGCFSVRGRFGAPISAPEVERIERNVTTREQITAWFGPPNAFYRPGLLELILGGENGTQSPISTVTEDVYSYRYIESHARLWLLPIFVLRASAKTRSQSLTVFFNEDGTVRYYGYRLDEPGDVLGEDGS